MRHIIKHQSLPRLQGAIKTVVADHITGKTGHPTQPIRVRFLASRSRAKNLGTVGHLQRIRHMAGGRRIQNSLITVGINDIQHFGD